MYYTWPDNKYKLKKYPYYIPGISVSETARLVCSKKDDCIEREMELIQPYLLTGRFAIYKIAKNHPDWSDSTISAYCYSDDSKQPHKFFLFEGGDLDSKSPKGIVLYALTEIVECCVNHWVDVKAITITDACDKVLSWWHDSGLFITRNNLWHWRAVYEVFYRMFYPRREYESISRHDVKDVLRPYVEQCFKKFIFPEEAEELFRKYKQSLLYGEYSVNLFE